MKNKNISALLLFIAGPIALLASSDTDRKIEESAKASYNYQTVLEDHVKVKAKDGVVTLSGTVRDNDEKALAVDTVENIPGVTSVRNEIKVKSDHPEKSDGWIALKIRSQLLVKGNVSATSTKVTSQDGVVTLTGTADNMAQKELTEVYAKEIDGVRSVRNEIVVVDKASTNNLTADNTRRDGTLNGNARNDGTIRDGTADNSRRETMGDKMDDASITSQVKYALLKHKSTSAIKTKITTNDGAIIITGVAANEAEKSLVTKLAGDVRGVRSVNNNMTVTKS